MNIHKLHQEYCNADYDKLVNHVFPLGINSRKLFNKGDFGMIIAPPATEEFTVATAMSTCVKASGRVINSMAPKMKSCVFIDTLSSKEKLMKDMKNAESCIGGKLTKGFKLATAQEVYSPNESKNEFKCVNENTLECVSSFIANKYSDVQCIFVMLDSVIFAPHYFEKAKFDRFIAWASEIKKQGKTLVVISHYQVPQTKYLADHMDFVINCIPDQRGGNGDMCAFVVQWLSLRFSDKFDSNAVPAENLNPSRSHIINMNPHFALMGFNYFNGKRGWCETVSTGCIISYPNIYH